jgi:hypothetical protein
MGHQNLTGMIHFVASELGIMRRSSVLWLLLFGLVRIRRPGALHTKFWRKEVVLAAPRNFRRQILRLKSEGWE